MGKRKLNGTHRVTKTKQSPQNQTQAVKLITWNLIIKLGQPQSNVHYTSLHHVWGKYYQIIDSLYAATDKAMTLKNREIG